MSLRDFWVYYHIYFVMHVLRGLVYITLYLGILHLGVYELIYLLYFGLF